MTSGSPLAFFFAVIPKIRAPPSEFAKPESAWERYPFNPPDRGAMHSFTSKWRFSGVPTSD
jgi:hypothetical protein